jgi:hypothetical protein
MDAPVAGEALAFEGWRFDPRAGGLLRHGASGVWVPVSVGARARDVVVFFCQSYAREIAEANGWQTLATSSAKLVNILGGCGYRPVLLSMRERAAGGSGD